MLKTATVQETKFRVITVVFTFPQQIISFALRHLINSKTSKVSKKILRCKKHFRHGDRESTFDILKKPHGILKPFFCLELFTKIKIFAWNIILGLGTFFEFVSQYIIPPNNQKLSNTTLTNLSKTKEEKSEDIISFSANYYSEELQGQKPYLIKKKSSKYKQMGLLSGRSSPGQ